MPRCFFKTQGAVGQRFCPLPGPPVAVQHKCEGVNCRAACTCQRLYSSRCTGEQHTTDLWHLYQLRCAGGTGPRGFHQPLRLGPEPVELGGGIGAGAAELEDPGHVAERVNHLGLGWVPGPRDAARLILLVGPPRPPCHRLQQPLKQRLSLGLGRESAVGQPDGGGEDGREIGL